MATTKLKLWKEALRELGQPTITATDVGELNSQTLAEVYDDTVNYCLEQGYWNHAITTLALATQGAVGASATGGGGLFDYIYPYPKPPGWLKTVRLSASNRYWPPLEDYEDAGGQFHADITPIYAVYLATGPGLDLTKWPDSFSTYVSGELARRICKRIGGSQQDYEDLEKRTKMYLYDARSKDAMNEGTRYMPEGKLSMVRRRGRGRGDRGNRGSLTG